MVAVVPVIGSWNTRPRNVARLNSGSPVTSTPSIRIEPSSTGQEPAMALSIVDLPAPFPPMTVTKSPSSRVRSTPFKACFSLIVPRLKVLCTLRISKIYLPSFADALLKAAAERFPAFLKELLLFPFRYGTARKIATMIAVNNFRSSLGIFSQRTIPITI